MTDFAVQKVSEIMKKGQTPEHYLKIGLKGGGCSGFMYLYVFSYVFCEYFVYIWYIFCEQAREQIRRAKLTNVKEKIAPSARFFNIKLCLALLLNPSPGKTPMNPLMLFFGQARARLLLFCCFTFLRVSCFLVNWPVIFHFYSC